MIDDSVYNVAEKMSIGDSSTDYNTAPSMAFYPLQNGCPLSKTRFHQVSHK